MKTLIKAITGSRAYGLDTPDSDHDSAEVFALEDHEFYGIVPLKERKQEISSDGISDINYWSIRTFITGLYSGNHLAYELLRSPKIEADKIGKEILALGKRQLYSAALARRLLSFHKAMKWEYIKSDRQSIKMLSHALRTQIYIIQLLDKGYFKPKLEQLHIRHFSKFNLESEKDNILCTDDLEIQINKNIEHGRFQEPDFNLYNDFCIKIHKVIYQ